MHSLLEQNPSINGLNINYIDNTIMSSSKYGSTDDNKKNDIKQVKINKSLYPRIMIDYLSILNTFFTIIWIISICGRPALISSLHFIIFGVYIILGGILIHEKKPNQLNPSVLCLKIFVYIYI